MEFELCFNKRKKNCICLPGNKNVRDTAPGLDTCLFGIYSKKEAVWCPDLKETSDSAAVEACDWVELE